jgi:hypothetical protein
VAETGDFNGDGTTDILWRQDSGALALWEMQDGDVLIERDVRSFDTTWTVEADGDFNGDGTSDILWRRSDGQVAIFEMQDGEVAVERGFAGFPSASPAAPDAWEIAAANDVTGDGTTDILWRSDSGFVASWEMQDGVLAIERAVGFFDNTWTLIDV